ncbi:MAG TPA: 30S ribosomal protein S12 methylthiotransferase RimO, partial [Nitrospiraceae bacterium]|nr:30S ribosomal protein S12 methylthiotransferase RimO [Nitrospiraceae bacterium]
MPRKPLTVISDAPKTTIGFVNLGCTKNQVDAEVMLGVLAAKGFALTTEPDQAQVVIINTCGFIEEAKQESIDTIIEYGELKRTGACKVLIASGCLAQRYQGDLLKELPELDGVVGTGEIGRIADITQALLKPGRQKQRLWMAPPPYLYDELTPRIRIGKQHSAYVKIAEGCNRTCAFCAIPLMRGKQRSRPIASIVEEARHLAAEGVREVNLISQDTINYGVDLGIRRGLTTLLSELVQVEGLRWIRPFYLYPQQVEDALIDLYAGQEKIAKYIDMPLQHINDTMLKSMHRLGGKRYITNLVNRLRQRIPGLTFRTAFIVGFPGETDTQFRELKQYLSDMEFDRVGIFIYSDEDDTPAVEFSGKLDRRLMEERRAELLALQESISLKRGRQKIGSTLEVLVEGPSEETDLLLAARHEGQAPEIDGVVYINDIEGRSENTNLIQIRRDTVVPCPGDFVKVQITEAAAYDLVG